MSLWSKLKAIFGRDCEPALFLPMINTLTQEGFEQLATIGAGKGTGASKEGKVRQPFSRRQEKGAPKLLFVSYLIGSVLAQPNFRCGSPLCPELVVVIW